MIDDIINNLPIIYIGKGNASYKMGNGGVFNYKENITWKEKLETVSIIKAEGCYTIEYIVKNKGINLTLKLIKEEKNIKFKFLSQNEEINRVWITLPSNNAEAFYGCGETFTKLNLKGSKVRIWVAEHQNLKRIIKKFIGRKVLKRKADYVSRFEKYDSYYVQPTFISSKKYFVHIDTAKYCEFDFSKEDTTTLMIREIPSEIIIGEEDNFENLIESLSGILGRQPNLPEWVYNGMILGIQGGRGVVLEKIKKVKENNGAISGVWCQDWQGIRITAFGKQLMWNWQYDNELYPDLKGMIENLEKENLKFLGYINPFLAVEESMYKYASSKGYCVKNNKGEDYMVTITTFPAAMIDLTNPNAVKWIKDIIKDNMIGIGMKGWMADFGEYMPTDAVVYSKENCEDIHNLWPTLWAKVNREAIQESGMEKEIFFFTRAGYTDTIKYSTLMWNGDQHVDFSYDDGLPSVIPSSLSLGLCGFGIVHSDIGGYTTLLDMKRSKDLFIRWLELCAFSPIMRSHEGNRPESNVQFDHDEEVLDLVSKMTNVYLKLSVYLKMLVKENSEKGIPVMRPLFMYYDEIRAYNEQYQYLLGKDLLVAPVIEENSYVREVYLPEDKWIHLWTGNKYSGGVYNVEASYGNIPVFYKEDSEFAQLFKDIANVLK